MKKRVIFYLFVSATIFSACSSDTKETELDWKCYKTAVENGDFISAVNSLNRIHNRNKFDFAVLDSMAITYFNAGMSLPAYKTGIKALENSQNKETLLMVIGESAEKLRDLQEANVYYEKIVEANPNNVKYTYKVGVNYFNLGVFDKSMAFIKRVIENPEAKNQTLNFNTDNQNQQIPYIAAAWNVVGFIYLNQNQKSEASQAFSKALEIAPDFVLAKNNLNAINKK